MRRWFQRILLAVALAVLVLGGKRVWLFAQEGGARLSTAFAKADRNNDGQLSGGEIARFPKLVALTKGADADGDGLISEKEFRRRLLAATGQQNADSQPATGKISAGDVMRSIDVGKVRRRYLLHVPKSYDAKQPTPLVIAFHGGGGNPESMIRLSHLNEKSDQAGFMVAYPYGSGRDPARKLTFNGQGCCGYAMQNEIDDVGFTGELIDDLIVNGNIDERRIYATGISNGGIMSYRLACELSDRIAAIASVSGPMMMDSCNPSRPISVMHFHGTADELAPFDGGRGKGTANVPEAMRPEFTSVKSTIETWVRVNQCKEPPTIKPFPNVVNDGMSSTEATWSGGKGGSEVVLIEIENGGHTWPGQEPISEIIGRSTKDISANDLMWTFFERHPRR
jgi:poly(3-hydroxybutyrate) depolymerase